MSEIIISSLYECLQGDKKIEIPLIQRDYAQGRKTESELRKVFLRDLKNAIDNDKEMILDFVYGNENRETFYPLDGQQRLTTLWLIHWYIAFKRGRLNENLWLGNFAYKVRISSTEFCKRICQMTWRDLEETNKNKMSIAEYIQRQPWFYSQWIQDPTINSMLRTISGEDYNKGADSVEGVFDGDIKEWNRLIKSNQVKIKFNMLKITSDLISNTDNLYVKMNSRGKRLSDYENYKADFVEYLKEIAGKENDISVYYPEQFDIEWTDALWSYHSNGEIDNIYFSLMNRLFLNEYIIKQDFSAKAKDEAVFKLLNAYDKNIEYKSFDIYKGILDGQHINVLSKWDKLFKLLKYYGKEMLAEITTVIEEEGEEEHESMVSIIPTYDEFNKGKTPTQKDRVYLLAICEFVKQIKQEDIDKICECDDNKRNKEFILKNKMINQYGKWMRVARNLIENAAIENQEAMISAMKLICKIAERIDAELKSDILQGDIYNIIKSIKVTDYEENDNERKRQLEEEIEKAGIIVDGWKSTTVKLESDTETPADREKSIKNSENHAFFNGTIRFLLCDKNGDFIRDKELFNKKVESSKALFKGSDATAEARKVFRSLISDIGVVFAEPDMSVTSLIGFQKRGFSWKKKILNNDVFCKEVDVLLQSDSIKTDNTDQYIVDRDVLFKKIDDVEDKKSGKEFVCQIYYGEQVLHRRNSHKDYLFISDERKAFCKSLCEKAEIVVDNDYVEGYYFGESIRFSIRENGNDTRYVWRVRESKNKTSENRVFKIKDGEESVNYYKWEEPCEIDDLKEYLFIFQAKNKL